MLSHQLAFGFQGKNFLNEASKLSFSGHESFPVRHTWLPKGVAWCNEHNGFQDVELIMGELGLGKNMVRSIRHWCLATKMVEEVPQQDAKKRNALQPSYLGDLIFIDDDSGRAWDPYMEDIGTLWLIHWFLATNLQRASTWYLIFNHYYKPDFTKKSLESFILDVVESLPKVRTTPNTVKRDIDVFLRSYVQQRTPDAKLLEETLSCPLVELDLITPLVDEGRFRFNRGSKETLPDEVFAFTLLEYLGTKPDVKTISFEEICYQPYSPGRIFKFDEYSLAERLDRLTTLTRGALEFSETAGLKQLFIVKDVDRYSYLERYYRKSFKQAEALAV